jgi:hypothetical protein
MNPHTGRTMKKKTYTVEFNKTQLRNIVDVIDNELNYNEGAVYPKTVKSLNKIIKVIEDVLNNKEK